MGAHIFINRKIYRFPIFIIVSGLALVSGSYGDQSGNSHSGTGSKLLLIEFFSYNSIESKMLRDQIIDSGQTGAFICENFRRITVEQDRDKAMEYSYKVTTFPTLIIANPDRSEIDRIVGFLPPGEVIQVLNAALSGKSHLSHFKEQAAAPDAGMAAHFTLAEAYRARGNFDGALEEYRWLYKKAIAADKIDKAFLREVFAGLSVISRRDEHAFGEFREWRDTAEHAAQENSSDSRNIELAFLLNDALGEPSRNIPIFLHIEPSSPLRKSLFRRVFPALVRAGKYKEAFEAVDLKIFVTSLFSESNSGLARSAQGRPNRMDRARNQYITITSLDIIETLVANENVAGAKRITKMLFDYIGETREALTTQLILASQRAAQASAQSASDYATWLQNMKLK